jgi:hypothetical protein
MDASVGAVKELRTQGVNIIGYTWWCITDMMEWSYRPGTGKPMDYLLTMGLWALEEGSDGTLVRRKTPVADNFRRHALAAR